MKFKVQTLGTSAFYCIDNMPNMQISEYQQSSRIRHSDGQYRASIIREVLKSELHPNSMIRENGLIQSAMTTLTPCRNREEFPMRAHNSNITALVMAHRYGFSFLFTFFSQLSLLTLFCLSLVRYSSSQSLHLPLPTTDILFFACSGKTIHNSASTMAPLLLPVHCACHLTHIMQPILPAPQSLTTLKMEGIRSS